MSISFKEFFLICRTKSSGTLNNLLQLKQNKVYLKCNLALHLTTLKQPYYGAFTNCPGLKSFHPPPHISTVIGFTTLFFPTQSNGSHTHTFLTSEFAEQGFTAICDYKIKCNCHRWSMEHKHKWFLGGTTGRNESSGGNWSSLLSQHAARLCSITSSGRRKYHLSSGVGSSRGHWRGNLPIMSLPKSLWLFYTPIRPLTIDTYQQFLKWSPIWHHTLALSQQCAQSQWRA